ncbi:hypothetical protein [Roseibium algae]|uniref:Uncharacterized protein n=1 Tax=Roseibium algae TaxID=3123038 RepID=A0ABU8TI37_9HYPH
MHALVDLEQVGCEAQKGWKPGRFSSFGNTADGLFQIDPKDDEPAADGGVKALDLCKA